MVWTPMRAQDIAAAYDLSKEIHPGFPEDLAVLTEKFHLYPRGCFFCRVAGQAVGYAVSHPWDGHHLPALNRKLGTLPQSGTQYYIHDIALLAGVRRGGHGAEIVALIKRHAAAQGCTQLNLVAVNGSVPFWQRHGFSICPPGTFGEKLMSYGADARFMECRDLAASSGGG